MRPLSVYIITKIYKYILKNVPFVVNLDAKIDSEDDNVVSVNLTLIPYKQ